MITDTIQNALKRLFCSIGGNADNVRNKDDINAILDEMTALNIGEQISSSGTNVVANPTLAGTEADLEGLQVGDTKYKVGGSGGGVVEIPLDTSGGTTTLTKTGQEILDYISDGKLPYVVFDPTGGIVANAFILGVLNSIETDLNGGNIEGYSFYFYSVTAHCTSLGQYPVIGD